LLLADGLGATDLDFSNGLISQLANAGAQGQKVNVQALNFMLSAERSDRVDARGPDGRDPHGDHADDGAAC
jgi:hypothetical protein